MTHRAPSWHQVYVLSILSVCPWLKRNVPTDFWTLCNGVIETTESHQKISTYFHIVDIFAITLRGCITSRTRTDHSQQVSSKRASKRFSTYSGVPSLAASDATVTTNTSTSTNDPRVQEIKAWSQGFERLESKRLQQQRYTPSAEKSDNLSKIALGAKVERALGRRMSDQDAILKPRPKLAVLDEKAAVNRSITTSS